METPPRDDVRPHLVSDAIKRRWYLIVLLAVLLPAAVGAYLNTSSASYTAAAKVLVRPIPGNALSTEATGSNSQVTVAMETEASIVNSPDVTALANKGLTDDLEAGSPRVEASVPPNTEIVQIDFTASTAAEAREGAQAFAKAFLAYRAQQADATLKYQLDSLATQAKNAENSLKRAADIASADEPPPDAASQVQLYASRLASLQASTGQLQTLNTQPGTLITPARTPEAPAGLNPWLLIIAAAIAGLAGGLALAVWRERSDDHIRASSETSLLGVPVLASIPADHHRGPHLLDPDVDDRLHDAYRRARTGVLANAQPPTVVVLSAIARGVVVAPVAANLALSLARAGHRVTLVDASTDDRDTLRDVGIESDLGLSDVVMGLPLSELELTETHGVRVLTAGSKPKAAREHYAGKALTDVLERLREDADFVVVVAPPASTADGGSVALAGDVLVLAVQDHHTTHAQVADAIDRAERLGVQVLGALVVRRVRPRKRGAAVVDTSPTKATDDVDSVEQRPEDDSEPAQPEPDESAQDAPESDLPVLEPAGEVPSDEVAAEPAPEADGSGTGHQDDDHGRPVKKRRPATVAYAKSASTSRR